MDDIVIGSVQDAFPGRYDIIYADPPWKYKIEAMPGCAAEHYGCMTIGQLIGMKPFLDKIAAPNCALLMWATSPLLPDALDVIHGWGFKFKTVFLVWAKTYKHKTQTSRCGLGFYTRISTELLLLASRGRIADWVVDHSVNQILVAPAVEHSRKPEEVRGIILRVFGEHKRRIELFARATNLPSQPSDWDVWGNESTGRMGAGGLARQLHGETSDRKPYRQARQRGRPARDRSGAGRKIEAMFQETAIVEGTTGPPGAHDEEDYEADPEFR